MTLGAQHTPAPWRIGDQMGVLGAKMVCSYARLIASVQSHSMQPPDIDPTAQANAEHIVRCVNAHDELVRALQRIRDEEFDDLDPDDGLHRNSARALARAALAKASP